MAIIVELHVHNSRAGQSHWTTVIVVLSCGELVISILQWTQARPRKNEEGGASIGGMARADQTIFLGLVVFSALEVQPADCILVTLAVSLTAIHGETVCMNK